MEHFVLKRRNISFCGLYTEGVSAALPYFNATRIRALGRRGALQASAISDETAFMHEMMDERMRELNFEGWRKFDLIRTGLLTGNDRNGVPIMQRNKNFADFGVGTVNPNYRYWPIPLASAIQ